MTENEDKTKVNDKENDSNHNPYLFLNSPTTKERLQRLKNAKFKPTAQHKFVFGQGKYQNTNLSGDKNKKTRIKVKGCHKVNKTEIKACSCATNPLGQCHKSRFRVISQGQVKCEHVTRNDCHERFKHEGVTVSSAGDLLLHPQTNDFLTCNWRLFNTAQDGVEEASDSSDCSSSSTSNNIETYSRSDSSSSGSTYEESEYDSFYDAMSMVSTIGSSHSEQHSYNGIVNSTNTVGDKCTARKAKEHATVDETSSSGQESDTPMKRAAALQLLLLNKKEDKDAPDMECYATSKQGCTANKKIEKMKYSELKPNSDALEHESDALHNITKAAHVDSNNIKCCSKQNTEKFAAKRIIKTPEMLSKYPSSSSSEEESDLSIKKAAALQMHILNKEKETDAPDMECYNTHTRTKFSKDSIVFSKSEVENPERCGDEASKFKGKLLQEKRCSNVNMNNTEKGMGDSKHELVINKVYKKEDQIKDKLNMLSLSNTGENSNNNSNGKPNIKSAPALNQKAINSNINNIEQENLDSITSDKDSCSKENSDDTLYAHEELKEADGKNSRSAFQGLETNTDDATLNGNYGDTLFESVSQGNFNNDDSAYENLNTANEENCCKKTSATPSGKLSPFSFIQEVRKTVNSVKSMLRHTESGSGEGQILREKVDFDSKTPEHGTSEKTFQDKNESEKKLDMELFFTKDVKEEGLIDLYRKAAQPIVAQIMSPPPKFLEHTKIDILDDEDNESYKHCTGFIKDSIPQYQASEEMKESPQFDNENTGILTNNYESCPIVTEGEENIVSNSSESFHNSKTYTVNKSSWNEHYEDSMYLVNKKKFEENRQNSKTPDNTDDEEKTLSNEGLKNNLQLKDETAINYQDVHLKEPDSSNIIGHDIEEDKEKKPCIENDNGLKSTDTINIIQDFEKHGETNRVTTSLKECKNLKEINTIISNSDNFGFPEDPSLQLRVKLEGSKKSYPSKKNGETAKKKVNENKTNFAPDTVRTSPACPDCSLASQSSMKVREVVSPNETDNSLSPLSSESIESFQDEKQPKEIPISSLPLQICSPFSIHEKKKQLDAELHVYRQKAVNRFGIRQDKSSRFCGKTVERKPNFKTQETAQLKDIKGTNISCLGSKIAVAKRVKKEKINQNDENNKSQFKTYRKPISFRQSDQSFHLKAKTFQQKQNVKDNASSKHYEKPPLHVTPRRQVANTVRTKQLISPTLKVQNRPATKPEVRRGSGTPRSNKSSASPRIDTNRFAAKAISPNRKFNKHSRILEKNEALNDKSTDYNKLRTDYHNSIRERSNTKSRIPQKNNLNTMEQIGDRNDETEHTKGAKTFSNATTPVPKTFGSKTKNDKNSFKLPSLHKNKKQKCITDTIDILAEVSVQDFPWEQETEQMNTNFYELNETSTKQKEKKLPKIKSFGNTAQNIQFDCVKEKENNINKNTNRSISYTDQNKNLKCLKENNLLNDTDVERNKESTLRRAEYKKTKIKRKNTFPCSISTDYKSLVAAAKERAQMRITSGLLNAKKLYTDSCNPDVKANCNFTKFQNLHDSQDKPESFCKYPNNNDNGHEIICPSVVETNELKFSEQAAGSGRSFWYDYNIPATIPLSGVHDDQNLNNSALEEPETSEDDNALCLERHEHDLNSEDDTLSRQKSGQENTLEYLDKLIINSEGNAKERTKRKYNTKNLNESHATKTIYKSKIPTRLSNVSKCSNESKIASRRPKSNNLHEPTRKGSMSADTAGKIIVLVEDSREGVDKTHSAVITFEKNGSRDSSCFVEATDGLKTYNQGEKQVVVELSDPSNKGRILKRSTTFNGKETPSKEWRKSPIKSKKRQEKIIRKSKEFAKSNRKSTTPASQLKYFQRIRSTTPHFSEKGRKTSVTPRFPIWRSKNSQEVRCSKNKSPRSSSPKQNKSNKPKCTRSYQNRWYKCSDGRWHKFGKGYKGSSEKSKTNQKQTCEINESQTVEQEIQTNTNEFSKTDPEADNEARLLSRCDLFSSGLSNFDHNNIFEDAIFLRPESQKEILRDNNIRPNEIYIEELLANTQVALKSIATKKDQNVDDSSQEKSSQVTDSYSRQELNGKRTLSRHSSKSETIDERYLELIHKKYKIPSDDQINEHHKCLLEPSKNDNKKQFTDAHDLRKSYSLSFDNDGSSQKEVNKSNAFYSCPVRSVNSPTMSLRPKKKRDLICDKFTLTSEESSWVIQRSRNNSTVTENGCVHSRQENVRKSIRMISRSCSPIQATHHSFNRVINTASGQEKVESRNFGEKDSEQDINIVEGQCEISSRNSMCCKNKAILQSQRKTNTERKTKLNIPNRLTLSIRTQCNYVPPETQNNTQNMCENCVTVLENQCQNEQTDRNLSSDRAKTNVSRNRTVRFDENVHKSSNFMEKNNINESRKNEYEDDTHNTAEIRLSGKWQLTSQNTTATSVENVNISVETSFVEDEDDNLYRNDAPSELSYTPTISECNSSSQSENQEKYTPKQDDYGNTNVSYETDQEIMQKSTVQAKKKYRSRKTSKVSRIMIQKSTNTEKTDLPPLSRRQSGRPHKIKVKRYY